MPQLDFVSFFSQYVWLMFFYVGFYFLLVNSFLPKLSRILKVRAAKASSIRVAPTQTSDNSIESTNPELAFIGRREETAMARLRFAQQTLRQGFSNVNVWVETSARLIRSKGKATEAFKKHLVKDAFNHARVNTDVQSLLPISLQNNTITGGSAGNEARHVFHSKKLLSVLSNAK